MQYGNYLEQKRYFEDAALIFQDGGHNREAMTSWLKDGNWQFCIAKAWELNFSPAEITILYESLVQKLKEEKRFKEAAHLAKDFLKRDEEAVEILVEGCVWADSFTLIRTTNREDLMSKGLFLHIFLAGCHF